MPPASRARTHPVKEAKPGTGEDVLAGALGEVIELGGELLGVEAEAIEFEGQQARRQTSVGEQARPRWR